MKMLARIFDCILDLSSWICALIVAFTTMAVVAGVVMRCLDRPLLWSFEATEIGLLYVTFLGAAWVLKNGAHAKLDMIATLISARAYALLSFVTSLVSALACIVLAYYGIRASWTYYVLDVRKDTVLSFPDWAQVIVLAICAFLMSIQFIRSAHERFHKGVKDPSGSEKQT